MKARFGRMILVAAMTVAIDAGCSTSSGTISPGSLGGAMSPAASTSSGAAIPHGFPIGSWTTTLTEADLRVAGITVPGELTENAGLFTITFGADGTWTTTQETGVHLRWPVFRGTWTATGPNSYSQRTDFPADFAGDVVDFTWKFENGALVLEVVNPLDHVLPVIMETHPWSPAS